MPTRKVFLRINPTKQLPTIALFGRLISQTSLLYPLQKTNACQKRTTVVNGYHYDNAMVCLDSVYGVLCHGTGSRLKHF